MRGFLRWAFLFGAVLLAALGSWAGYRLLEYRRDQRVLEELATAEPSVGYEAASWGAPAMEQLGIPQSALLASPRVWRTIFPLFTRVDSVFLRDTSDADLDRSLPLIRRFSQPVELCIISDKITDRGLGTVAEMSNLDGVDICSPDARITDRGVAGLRALPQLETLSVDCRALTERCVLDIARFRRLRELTLSSVPVNVEGVQALARMSTLSRLDLRDAALSEEATERLQAFEDKHPEMHIMY
jgi:hypothetical protein